MVMGSNPIGPTFRNWFTYSLIIKNKLLPSHYMSKYTHEEGDMLIKILIASLPKKISSNIAKKHLGKKPFMNKTDKIIKYLEQRHKFFNPTKQMLEYVINVAENSNLDKAILKKMKEDLLTKG